MLKWAQNPKYYQNLISGWFVRKDTLGPYDVEIHTLMPKGWWYKHKAWSKDPRNSSILNEIIQSWEKMFGQPYPYLLRSSSFPGSV